VKTDAIRHTKTDALLAHIRGLGLDKYQNPIGIRTTALAAATGVPVNSIQVLLERSISHGDLVVCKITGARGRQEREYRVGPGVPPPEFKPLKVKPTWPDLTRQRQRPTAAPSLSKPLPACSAIETPVLIPPRPAVGKNSGSSAIGMPSANPSPEAPAVAAQATPGPETRARLKKEPAANKAPAGDVRIGINDSGTLVIAIDDDTLELNPKQARRLGHFMAGTAGVWNPF
jgi:hypothetical protein